MKRSHEDGENSPESSNHSSDHEGRTRPHRAVTLKNSESSENFKKVRRSVTPTILRGPFNKCVLHLGENCKTTVEGGHRISLTEACCISCFMLVFRGRDYENKYNEWKSKATDGQISTRTDQFIKRYINSKFLPFYKKCELCGKYDQIDSSEEMTAEDFADYKCPEGCDKMIEWSQLTAVKKNKLWYLSSSGFPPLLQNNVAFPLLMDNYVTRWTGMDATCQNNSKLVHDGGVPFRDTRQIMNMFYVPYTDVIAHIVHPEFMEADEKLEFCKFTGENASLYYLQIRNTIIAMWLKHPFVEITPKMVQAQIIVRGHARIFFIEHLIKPVLTFLTIKGVVNYGAFDFRIRPIKNSANVRVAIIGAGISGMSCARHLKHLGIDATLFEAKERFGGRMNDDKSLGVPVGKGAQIIVGNINNPITLLCEQLGIKYRNSNFFCPLVDESTGQCFTHKKKQLDDQVDMHYNNVLDVIRNKYSADKNMEDRPLEEIFNEISDDLLDAADLNHLKSPEFNKLLDFHLGNLEFSCGARVGELSAKEYDHNEKFGNFAGEHAVIVDGAQSIVDRLAVGLDIVVNSEVRNINYTEKEIIVQFADNRAPLFFDKVVVTTSLAVLKKKKAELFTPRLPEKKEQAIDELGAGLIEKIAVRFDRRFWSSVDDGRKKTEYFGKVPAKKEDRSLFNVFYDFSGKNEKDEDCYVLMSYVTADHVNLVNDFSEPEIVAEFVKSLQKMFPKAKIRALGQVVSKWGRDPHIGMSYTYVPYGVHGDLTYNALKESVGDRIYFAGEHTIASEPQTMTGAYISGIREAAKIVQSLERRLKTRES